MRARLHEPICFKTFVNLKRPVKKTLPLMDEMVPTLPENMYKRGKRTQAARGTFEKRPQKAETHVSTHQTTLDFFPYAEA